MAPANVVRGSAQLVAAYIAFVRAPVNSTAAAVFLDELIRRFGSGPFDRIIHRMALGILMTEVAKLCGGFFTVGQAEDFMIIIEIK